MQSQEHKLKPSANNELAQLINQAQTAEQEGNSARAKEIYQDLIVNQDSSAELLNIIASRLLKLNQHNSALLALERAVFKEPSNPDYYSNLASIYLKLRDFAKAKQHLAIAVKIMPHHADAQCNLGLLAMRQGNHLKARDTWEKVLQHQPNHINALNNLAYYYLGAGEARLAIPYLEEILKKTPDNIAANYQLALCYLNIYKPTFSYQYLNKINLTTCHDYELKAKILCLLCFSQIAAQNFTAFESNLSLLETALQQINNAKLRVILDPFQLQAINVSEDLQANNLQRFANFYQLLPQERKYKTSKKLKVAYISSNLNKHVIGFLLQQLLPYHDKNKFKVFGILTNKKKDDFTSTIAAACSNFTVFAPSEQSEIIKYIYDNGINVLVDLNGFSEQNNFKILAAKPAPIICHWLGFAGSLQHPAIDYFIADPILINNENRSSFSESIAYLPYHLALGNINIPYQSREKLGLPTDAFVYGCFCQNFRLQIDTLKCWVEILQKTPNSVLYLNSYDHPIDENILAFFAKHKLASRIYWQTNPIISQHFAMQCVDLYLDTTPISGATATLLALYSNVPVLTLANKNISSRTSYSLIHSVGLGDFVANNTSEYIKLAVTCATSNKFLTRLKNKLKATHSISAIFQPEIFMKNLESAYVQMWQQYNNGIFQDITIP